MKPIAARILTLAMAAAFATTGAMAQDGGIITGVPFANPKSGHPDNVVSPGFNDHTGQRTLAKDGIAREDPQ